MDRDIDVVVIGAGPTGLATALGLTRRGVATLVVERQREPSTLPRARALNGRTMEVLRRLGVANAISARATLPQPGSSIPFTFAETLATAGAPRELSPSSNGRRDYGPAPAVLCPQAVVEEILRAELPDGVLHPGVRAVPSAEVDDQVLVQLDGEGGRRMVRARYVVAADGANSATRAALGAEMRDVRGSASSLLVHFRADLSPWTGPQPSNIYFLGGVDGRCFLQPGAGPHEWVLNRIIELGAEPPANELCIESATRIVHHAVGAEPGVEVVAQSHWRLRSGVAERFVVGRVALAGDAAHVVSPFSGSGLNLGIQDADNVAWKIAAVLAGHAGTSLLDSYEPERRPAAQLTVDEDRRSLRAAVESGPTWRAWAEIVGARLAKAGLEYGIRYLSGAVEHTLGAASPPLLGSYAEYRPAAAPGDRAPHVWLPDDPERSILDLFGNGHVMLTADPSWVAPVEEAAGACRTPVRTVVLAPGAQWLATYGISTTGAVLVRPDGYVAWRAETGIDPARRGALLKSILGSCLFLHRSDEHQASILS